MVLYLNFSLDSTLWYLVGLMVSLGRYCQILNMVCFLNLKGYSNVLLKTLFNFLYKTFIGPISWCCCKQQIIDRLLILFGWCSQTWVAVKVKISLLHGHDVSWSEAIVHDNTYLQICCQIASLIIHNKPSSLTWTSTDLTPISGFCQQPTNWKR